MIDKSMTEGLCVPTIHIFTTSIPEGFRPCAMSSTNTTIEGDHLMQRKTKCS
jgi:hypothetical protein